LDVLIRLGDYDRDAKQIGEVAGHSPYTRHFRSPWYCNRGAFGSGFVVVAEIRGGNIVGFASVRHKKRIPETELDILGVHTDFRSYGIGERLVAFVMEQSKWRSIVLNVKNDNPRAIAFYKRLGFQTEGMSMKGTAARMRLCIPPQKYLRLRPSKNGTVFSSSATTPS